MAYRGSLAKCVAVAFDRLKRGECDLAIITHRQRAKYYTLYHPSELDAKLLNHPTTEERVVLSATGGELASIFDNVQLCLQMEEYDRAHPETVELGKQLGADDTETPSSEPQANGGISDPH